VLIHEKKALDLQPNASASGSCRIGKPLLIVAEDVEGEALATPRSIFSRAWHVVTAKLPIRKTFMRLGRSSCGSHACQVALRLDAQRRHRVAR